MGLSQYRPALFRPKLYLPAQPYWQILDESARRHPERTAIIYFDQHITYRELDGLVGAAAAALVELGVRPGERVCLFAANCPEYVIAFFAAARIGAVVTPMNPTYREQEARYQLADAGVRVVICDETTHTVVEGVQDSLAHLAHVVKIGSAGGSAVSFWDWPARFGPAPPPPPPLDPQEDLLVLPYSSGTTGLPKGVMLSHHSFYANNLQFCAAARVQTDSVLLIFLPLYHIYGAMLMGGAVAAGATQILLPRFDAIECLRNIERYRVTHWFCVPPVLLHYTSLGELADYDLSSVQMVQCGAAPLPPEIGRRFEELSGVPVVQGYGLTEAAPITHLNPVTEPPLRRLDSVGFQVSNQEQKVVDLETGTRVLPPGEVGEICVRGPHIMKGYWRAPEATAEALRDGWLHTGDIGRIDADGYVYVTDRKKEMIKFKGFGIAPAELESVLFEHPDVADCCVVGQADASAGELPVAFVVPKSGRAIDPDDLLRFVASKVAGYKRLHRIYLTDAIARNASGKLLRRVLRDRLTE